MILWVDAQFSPAIASWLAGRFHITSQHVQEAVSASASDRQIFEAARSAGATILTKDKDFVDLVRRRGSPPSVIWVTCGNTSNRAMFRTLELTFATACRLLAAGETVVEIRSGLHLPTIER